MVSLLRTIELLPRLQGGGIDRPLLRLEPRWDPLGGHPRFKYLFDGKCPDHLIFANFRLQNISKTGEDSRGLEGTPGDSKRRANSKDFTQ
jgi:hypothetical protein